MKNFLTILAALLSIFSACTSGNREQGIPVGPSHVEIHLENDKFNLSLNGEPYFIKGARTLGLRYMDRVAECGGNGVRIGFTADAAEVMDGAVRLGLTVLFGLPVSPERNGFDYSDSIAVREQFEKCREIVLNFRDHPALLMWAIGNELDHIPGDHLPDFPGYNLSMWDAVNDIARMIHELDPRHPAMTVIGTGNMHKMRDLIARCPDLDLLGMNAYADIVKVPGWLREYGWNKPYAVTEWGPSGHWEVPQTRWGVVIEETSTEKGEVYRRRYEEVIAADPWCVGSYAFLWASNRQERTHTWYNMYYDDGTRTAAVEAMQYLWTGEWPSNRCPRIESLTIDGLTARDDVALQAGSVHTATVKAVDPDGDPLRFVWELVPENKEFGAYAGQGETKPTPVDGVIREATQDGSGIRFGAPGEPGNNFRLYVYAYDAKGNIAHANIPFYVGAVSHDTR
jgi:hypothetical protein